MVILALSAGALSRGIVEFVRFLWSRPRPFVDHEVNLLLEELNSYSFPSAHAAFFFAISTVVFCYNKKAGLVLFLISFMISGARIFGGVHWFYDILGGLLVGILSGLIMLMIAKVLKK
jgi:undecaprenyl-diphosphatase